MAKLSRTSRYLTIPLVYRNIYKEGEVDLKATPIRRDKVFSRRYTNWKDVEGSFNHVVREGETLESICFKYYQRVDVWYIIADFNSISTFYPLILEENTVLTIPPTNFFGRVPSQI